MLCGEIEWWEGRGGGVGVGVSEVESYLPELF